MAVANRERGRVRVRVPRDGSDVPEPRTPRHRARTTCSTSSAACKRTAGALNYFDMRKLLIEQVGVRPISTDCAPACSSGHAPLDTPEFIEVGNGRYVPGGRPAAPPRKAPSPTPRFIEVGNGRYVPADDGERVAPRPAPPRPVGVPPPPSQRLRGLLELAEVSCEDLGVHALAAGWFEPRSTAPDRLLNSWTIEPIMGLMASGMDVAMLPAGAQLLAGFMVGCRGNGGLTDTACRERATCWYSVTQLGAWHETCDRHIAPPASAPPPTATQPPPQPSESRNPVVEFLEEPWVQCAGSATGAAIMAAPLGPLAMIPAAIAGCLIGYNYGEIFVQWSSSRDFGAGIDASTDWVASKVCGQQMERFGVCAATLRRAAGSASDNWRLLLEAVKDRCERATAPGSCDHFLRAMDKMESLRERPAPRGMEMPRLGSPTNPGRWFERAVTTCVTPPCRQ